MDSGQFIDVMNSKLKLVRTEYGLTQEKMAAMLGISKKTLVEIEKERKSLGWTCSVALASVFSDSRTLHDAIGGDIAGLIIALAFEEIEVNYPKTWGGRVWWKTVTEEAGYRIQQNMFSGHYRLIDQENRRVYSSFSLPVTENILKKVLR